MCDRFAQAESRSSEFERSVNKLQKDVDRLEGYTLSHNIVSRFADDRMCPSLAAVSGMAQWLGHRSDRHIFPDLCQIYG